MLLQARSLTVGYRSAGRELRALDCVDLDLSEHECLGVVGESGSGKTQLLLALLGLLGPQPASPAASAIAARNSPARAPSGSRRCADGESPWCFRMR
jgi:ABC-type glutathione transport system ATPase component